MTILVFGKTGQVATALGRLPDVLTLGRDDVDITDPAAVAGVFTRFDPRAVINAAAYTAVDQAETDPALAFAINAEGPKHIADQTRLRGIPFVHISTDYVFDGLGHDARFPHDPTDPQNIYGKSKRAGEQAVVRAGGSWAVLRTSWVFSATGSNFLKTMLRLGREHDHLRIVSDQIGGPTPAAAIADATVRMVEMLEADRSKSGIYHLSGTPDVSWAKFARTIFSQAGLPVLVEEIETRDYPTPAQRPLNSRLDCTQTDVVFGLKRPDWQQAVRAILNELVDGT